MKKRINMMTIEELEEKIKKYNNLTFIVKADDEELLEEYKTLKEKLKDKDDEIEYLNEVIDGLEEEKDELENKNYKLIQELKENKVRSEGKMIKIKMQNGDEFKKNMTKEDFIENELHYYAQTPLGDKIKIQRRGLYKLNDDVIINIDEISSIEDIK